MAKNQKQKIMLITLPYSTDHNAPAGHDNSDQFQSSFAAYFIENYSKSGDKVFDPFLGFGTTAFATEELKRVPYGIEADRNRFEWAAGQLEHWNNIRHGDAGDLAGLCLPKMDLCVTSPPFMPITDKWNPLYGGNPAHAGYDNYLKRLDEIFEVIAAQMKRGAHVIVHADNIRTRRFTPLVRDFSTHIAKHLRPENEITIRWEGTAHQTHTNALIFKKI
jgi:hypothetical protein